jgi:hypothetical protein
MAGPYKAKAGSDVTLSVVDEYGQLVPQGRVVRISFPSTSIDTPHSKVHFPEGCTADIEVDGTVTHGVPLVILEALG